MPEVNEFGLPADMEWLYAPNNPYVRREDCELRLQIIFPYRREWNGERFPVVLFVPGAAWYRQEMYNSVPQWAKLAERGVVLAAVQVRSSGEAKFPAQTDDLLAAMRHIASDAERWHIDPQRMYLCGHSSGAHIALLTAMARQREIAEAPEMRLRGVITLSAPTDMTLCGSKPSCDLLGVEKFSDAPEKVAAASCGTYITEGAELPPVLLVHGTEDDVVPIEHSRRLYGQLQKAGKSAKLYEIPGAGHGGAWQWSQPVLDRMMQFIHESSRTCF